MRSSISSLVAALTPSEKAYFKKFTARSGSKGKNYLALYDIIEKNPEREMNELKAELLKKIGPKHWSSEVDYLFKQLMNSLVNYHFNTTQYRKLIQFILYIDILKEKNEKRKAHKILRQAKKIAYQFEEFSIILKLIEIEENILFRQGILSFERELNELQAEREHIVTQIRQLNTLRLLREKVRSLQFTDAFVADPEKYPEIFEHPLMQSDEHISSKKALENFYYTRGFIYYLLRDFEKGHEYDLKHLHFFETNEDIFPKSRKLPVLSNALYLAALINNKTSFKSSMGKLDEFSKEPYVDQHYISYIKYSRYMELYYHGNDRISLKKILPEISQFVQKNHKHLAETQIDYIVKLVTRSYITLADYRTVMEWINFWYTVPHLDVSSSFRRIFTMMTYYKLSLWRLLSSEVMAARKELRKLQRIGSLEKVMLSFFRRISSNPHDERRLLKELRKKLETIKEDPRENKDFIYFDYYAWSLNPSGLQK